MKWKAFFIIFKGYHLKKEKVANTSFKLKIDIWNLVLILYDVQPPQYLPHFVLMAQLQNYVTLFLKIQFFIKQDWQWKKVESDTSFKIYPPLHKTTFELFENILHKFSGLKVSTFHGDKTWVFFLLNNNYTFDKQNMDVIINNWNIEKEIK